MKFAKRQAGLGAISTILAVLFVVFVAYLVMMIVPVYIDDWQAQKIVGNLNEKEDGFFSMSKEEILNSVDRRFSISSIYDIKPREVLKIKASGGKVAIKMHYDREVPIVHNLYVLMKFRHDFDFSK